MGIITIIIIIIIINKNRWKLISRTTTVFNQNCGCFD